MSYPASIQPITSVPTFQGVGNSVYQPFTSDRNVQTAGVADDITLQVLGVPADGDTLTFVQGAVSFVYTFKVSGADVYNKSHIDISGAATAEAVRNAIHNTLQADFLFGKDFAITKQSTDSIEIRNTPSGEWINSSLTASDPLTIDVLKIAGTLQVDRINYALFLLPYIEEPCRGSETYKVLPRLVLPYGFSRNYLFDLSRSLISYLKFDLPPLDAVSPLILDGAAKKYRFQIGELFGDNSTSDKLFNAWGQTISPPSPYTEKDYGYLLYPYLFLINAKTDEYAALIRANKYGNCFSTDEVPDVLGAYFNPSGVTKLLCATEKDSMLGCVDYFTFWNGHRRGSDMAFVVTQYQKDGTTIETVATTEAFAAINCCPSDEYDQLVSIPLRLVWDSLVFDFADTSKVCFRLQGSNYYEAEAIAMARRALEKFEANYASEAFGVDYEANAFGFFDIANTLTAGLYNVLGNIQLTFETAKYLYATSPAHAHAGGTRTALACFTKDGSSNSYMATIFTLDGITFHTQITQADYPNIPALSDWNGSALVPVDGVVLDLGTLADITESLTIHLQRPTCNFITMMYQNSFGVADTLHIFRGKEETAKVERSNFSPTLNRYESDYDARLSDRKDATYDANYQMEFQTVVNNAAEYAKTQILQLALSNSAYEVINNRGASTDTGCVDCGAPCTVEGEAEESAMPILLTSKNVLLQSGSKNSTELTIAWQHARDVTRKLGT